MKTKWVPYTTANFSAETPFNVRASATAAPVKVVFNQFGQLLTADTRRIVEDAPAEMEVEDGPSAPAAKPVTP